MAGPILRSYKASSIIYFEKDKADDIYVLQKGRIVLTYMSPDGKSEIKEDVKLGEFFGVKSALGRYPREETAQVLGGATVLVFKMPDFEAFVATKTHLILKMMKVFSSQLRQIHNKVREQLGQFGDVRTPSYELMNVAEVYHKLGDYDHSIYAYEKYLSHYPGGNYAGRATELLNLAKRNSMYPMNMSELVYEPERKGGGSSQAGGGAAAPTSSSGGGAGKQLTEMFNKAESLFDSGKTEEAVAIYRNLMDYKEPKSPEEDRIKEISTYKFGIGLGAKGDHDEAYNVLSGYVRKYPKGEKVKDSIFNLASISEQKGEKEKAVMLYNKVLTLQPEDSLSEDAKAKIAELKG
ncbi:MAG: cyclic nucleotide-binding domain-containing protein [Leptospiraceae bacterium]|nr:cyclic nucleotide-binding domain-containing protein [Leptospiraceae bacterium]